MKKCPMTLEWIGGTQLKGDITAGGPCIGADCAAYVEQMRPVKDRTSYFVSDITGEKQYINIKEVLMWSCAMIPRENWIDVEEK